MLKKSVIIFIIIAIVCFLIWCFFKYILLDNGVSLKYEEWNEKELLAKQQNILNYIKYARIIGLTSFCLALLGGVFKMCKS